MLCNAVYKVTTACIQKGTLMLEPQCIKKIPFITVQLYITNNFVCSFQWERLIGKMQSVSTLSLTVVYNIIII